MSIKKTIDYVYQLQLVDLLDVIREEPFSLRLFMYDDLIIETKMPVYEIPIIYNGYTVSKLSLKDGWLEVHLKEDKK